MTSTLEPVEAPPAPPLASGGRRSDRSHHLAGTLALVLAGMVGGGFIAHLVAPSRTALATPNTQAVQPPGGFAQQPAQSPTGSGPADAAALAAKVDPAVVDINTTVDYGAAQAAGTGMVLTSDGEVLTNNHVIDGATAISVTDVGNGQTYRATVVGYDKSADVAVLQLQNASGLATVATTSSTPAVGAGVVGIGNAGGAGGTPSYAAGVITATDQTITASDSADGTSEQLTGLLETDANIVAGDSGGPLVNAQGQVVGMDTAASGSYRFTQASQAYAIPIGTALQIAQQIEAGQASDTVHVGPTAMLGVGVQPDSRFGGNGSGATIVNVMSGSPAANAGLTAGDTIVAVAGHDVTSATSLSDVMLQQIPGSTVTVRYLDPNGATHSVPVHLATGPPQ